MTAQCALVSLQRRCAQPHGETPNPSAIGRACSAAPCSGVALVCRCACASETRRSISLQGPRTRRRAGVGKRGRKLFARASALLALTRGAAPARARSLRPRARPALARSAALGSARAPAHNHIRVEACRVHLDLPRARGGGAPAGVLPAAWCARPARRGGGRKGSTWAPVQGGARHASCAASTAPASDTQRSRLQRIVLALHALCQQQRVLQLP